MATKKQPAPPIIHPAFDTPKTPEPEAPHRITGVGDRGAEQRVPFVVGPDGHKYVDAPHPAAGQRW